METSILSKYTWKDIVQAMADLIDSGSCEDDFPEFDEFIREYDLTFEVLKPFIDKMDKQKCLDYLVNTFLLVHFSGRVDFNDLIGEIINYLVSQGAIFPEDKLVIRRYDNIILNQDNPHKYDPPPKFDVEVDKTVIPAIKGLGSITHIHNMNMKEYKERQKIMDEYYRQCREKDHKRRIEKIFLLSEEIQLYKTRGIFIDILAKNDLLTDIVIKYIVWNHIKSKDLSETTESNESVETNRLSYLKFCSEYLTKNY